MTIATLTIDQVLALTTHQLQEVLTKASDRINQILSVLKSPLGPVGGSLEEKRLNTELRSLSGVRKVLWGQLQEQTEQGTNVYQQQAA